MANAYGDTSVEGRLSGSPISPQTPASTDGNNQEPSTLRECRLRYSLAVQEATGVRNKITNYYDKDISGRNYDAYTAAVVRDYRKSLVRVRQSLEYLSNCAANRWTNSELQTRFASHGEGIDSLIAICQTYLDKTPIPESETMLETGPVGATLNGSGGNIDPRFGVGPVQLPFKPFKMVPTLIEDMEEFRPNKLLTTATLSEFRHWKAKYRLYIYASNIQNCDPSIQSAMITLNIDKDLENLIHALTFTPSVTFNPNDDAILMEQEIIPSHMQILTFHFEISNPNPIYIRRAALVSYKPARGQKASAYFEEFNRRMVEADANGCTVDEVLARICISQISDYFLRTQLMALSYRRIPTLEEVITQVATHEASQASIKTYPKYSPKPSLQSQRGRRRGKGRFR